MVEVINDFEAQFMVVCDAANEVSAMLEASTAQYSSTSNELTAMKMLNSVALLCSASSRSSSSRLLINSSSSREAGYESSNDFSNMFRGTPTETCIDCWRTIPVLDHTTHRMRRTLTN